MQPDTLDRDFHAYRQHRDPAALAAVFDAAAPRLLLVAMHLCRDASTAEDLVQTVFLQVLRDVDRFDARRPVMPWLLGMLEHRASDLRRSAHVRREQTGDATSVVARGNPPERAAAANEVRERVAEALAGMPRDYRDVLALRLVHGLSAVEIAHAHGLPPATVRTRLRRGLELLRGALPRGLATRGLLALLAAELTFARDGLSAVRTKVLAAAAASTGAATFAFGWWLALAATMLLGAGGWWWLAPGAVTTPRIDASATPVVAANEAAARGRPHDGGSGANTTGPAAQRTAVADPRTTTIRGRAVDASTGVPIGGVVAKLRTWPSNGVETPDWRDPEPVASSADGTFVVPFVPSRHRDVEICLAAAGHVEEFESWEPLREGVDVDMGDVRMRPGTPVRLRLLCDGQPLGGVPAFASPSPNGERPLGVGGHGPSDADGFVDLGTCEPGPWWHELRTAHVGAEARFEVPLQREPIVVVVELREPPRDRSISGVLVDTSGAPVAGIELGMPRKPYGHLVATTRSDGRFLWAQGVTPPASARERIELFGSRGDLQWVDDGGEVGWGTHDLRLVVRRRALATLRLEVFDAATQQPVEAFGATCKTPSELGSGSAERRRVAIEPHAGGVATFELPPGDHLASVFAAEPFAESAEIPVRLDEGRTTTLRVPLRPPAGLTVDVVDVATGRALEGVELALMKAVVAENTRNVPSEWYQSFRRNPASTGSGGRIAVVVLARGTSDARGRVLLRAPADLPRLVLVAGGPRCVASEHHDVALPTDGAQTTIRVVPATEVRGTLGPRTFVECFGPSPERLAEAAAQARIAWSDPKDLTHCYPRVVLRSLSNPSSPGLHTTVAPDGTFAVGGVPSGRWAVRVEATAGGSRMDLGALAAVDVDSSRETPHIALDAAPLMPAHGTVQFFVDGTPASGGAGLLRFVDGGTDEIRLQLDANGRATTPWLLPGTYVPFASVGTDHRVHGAERFVVRAGVDFTTAFALQRRDVTITILGANGAPAAECIVWGEQLDHPELGTGMHWWLRGRTDAKGRLVLPSPTGRLRLRAFARDQDLRDRDAAPALLLGDVAADANAATFRLPR